MKIFFCASIRGKEKNIYQEIVKMLKSGGHQAFADHILKTNQETVDSMTSAQKDHFHKKILSQIRNSDILVAEISYSSMSVGYLVAQAVSFQKPTIVLFSGKEKSNLLSSLESLGHLYVIQYHEIRDLKIRLANQMQKMAKKLDTRFTLLLPPRIVSFLNELSLKKGMPKSAYIRNLIEKDMNRKIRKNK